jgi:hypothetical protein
MDQGLKKLFPDGVFSQPAYDLSQQCKSKIR